MKTFLIIAAVILVAYFLYKRNAGAAQIPTSGTTGDGPGEGGVTLGNQTVTAGNQGGGGTSPTST